MLMMGEWIDTYGAAFVADAMRRVQEAQSKMAKIAAEQQKEDK